MARTRAALIVGWVFAGCAPPGAPPDSCDPENNAYETAGCPCRSDEDCTCQAFDGAGFEDEAMGWVCGDDGTCLPCVYF